MSHPVSHLESANLRKAKGVDRFTSSAKQLLFVLYLLADIIFASAFAHSSALDIVLHFALTIFRLLLV